MRRNEENMKHLKKKRKESACIEKSNKEKQPDFLLVEPEKKIENHEKINVELNGVNISKIDQDIIYFGTIIKMSIWMTRFNWRTAKQQEADVIRGYIFEQWIEECAKDHAERVQQAEWDEEDRKAYERARDAGDKVASNFADRHFGRM